MILHREHPDSREKTPGLRVLHSILVLDLCHVANLERYHVGGLVEGLLRTSEGAKDGGLDWVRTGESAYVFNIV